MGDCIFCGIVEGKVPSVKIWEDDRFMAFLDVMPNTKGMTLVIPKVHMDSYLFDKDDDLICDIVAVGRKVANILEKGLDVKRVALVMEGLGVNHLHLKLYPIFGLDEKFEETWADEKVFFDKYEGYITTKTGPEKTIEELEEVKEEIFG